MISFYAVAKQQLKKPIFIFVHGIFDSKKQAERYKEILGQSVIGFDFDDALSFPLLHKPFTTCFVQGAEIEKLSKIYNRIVHYFESKNMPLPPIVLVGLSRGASVILNFLALKKPKYIKAVILESPFDHIEHLLGRGILKKGFNFSYKIVSFLCSYIFPYYNPKGLQPIYIINQINKDIPLLFIASMRDQRVPSHATIMLYYFLRKNGHQKISLKIFEKGRHAKILRNNKEEYKTAVKEFLHQI